MLRNLVGVVTGGASGLGKATAMLLAKEQCKITICDLPNSAGKDVLQDLLKLQPDADFTPADIRSTGDIEKMFQKLYNKHSRLDFLVNCAGLTTAHKLYNAKSGTSINLDSFKYIYETNVFGMLNVILQGSKIMAHNKPDEDGLRGTIINVFGIEAYDGQIGQVGSAASSGAIASTILPLTRDLSENSIRVNGICIGLIDSPLTQVFPPKIEKFLTESCLGPKRFGTGDEFAKAVKFILENKYMNSSILKLDAGIKLNLV